MVRDVVMGNLFSKPSPVVSQGNKPLPVFGEGWKRTLWKKKRPIQPSVGRSTVAAAPRRKDHSSFRKCGIVGSEWWRKVIITEMRVSDTAAKRGPIPTHRSYHGESCPRTSLAKYT